MKQVSAWAPVLFIFTQKQLILNTLNIFVDKSLHASFHFNNSYMYFSNSINK